MAIGNNLRFDGRSRPGNTNYDQAALTGNQLACVSESNNVSDRLTIAVLDTDWIFYRGTHRAVRVCRCAPWPRPLPT